jgi:hypothetical protein
MVHGARGMVHEKLRKASLFWCHQFARCAGARTHHDSRCRTRRGLVVSLAPSEA